MLDVDALDRADPLREVEDLELAEWFCRVPAPVRFPDDRRIQAFLDRRPDRERRCEVVTLNDQVGTVPDTDLIDRVEKRFGRVASEDVGQSGLDPHPY